MRIEEQEDRIQPGSTCQGLVWVVSCRCSLYVSHSQSHDDEWWLQPGTFGKEPRLDYNSV